MKWPLRWKPQIIQDYERAQWEKIPEPLKKKMAIVDNVLENVENGKGKWKENERWGDPRDYNTQEEYLLKYENTYEDIQLIESPTEHDYRLVIQHKVVNINQSSFRKLENKIRKITEFYVDPNDVKELNDILESLLK